MSDFRNKAGRSSAPLFYRKLQDRLCPFECIIFILHGFIAIKHHNYFVDRAKNEMQLWGLVGLGLISLSGDGDDAGAARCVRRDVRDGFYNASYV